MNIDTTNAPNTTKTTIGFLPHVIGSLSFFNADNLEIMRGFKDNEFDLAIVDPPYGIDMAQELFKRGKTCKKNGYKEHLNKDWISKFQNKYTLMNYLELAKIKLFGVQII